MESDTNKDPANRVGAGLKGDGKPKQKGYDIFGIQGNKKNSVKPDTVPISARQQSFDIGSKIKSEREAQIESERKPSVARQKTQNDPLTESSRDLDLKKSPKKQSTQIQKFDFQRVVNVANTSKVTPYQDQSDTSARNGQRSNDQTSTIESGVKKQVSFKSKTKTNTSQISQTRLAANVWRKMYDQNMLYQLDKSFKVGDYKDAHSKELSRWKNNDIKGLRKTFYEKIIQQKTDKIMTITEQTKLEKLNHYSDRWPCLSQRKGCLKVKIYIQMTAEKIISHNMFDNIVLLIIMLNCVSMIMQDANREETEIEKNIELTFQILYTLEMVLKILGLGFIFGKHSYLRSIWNQLDFLIVTSGYLTMIQGSGGGGGGVSVSGLRAFRVLRPLRTVTKVEGLKIQIQSVVAAFPLLKNTIIVLIFFFLIFAIGGVNMFSGMLLQRCVEIETGRVVIDETSGEDFLCGDDSHCGEDAFCGKRTLNPNFDVTNFDNIAWAMLLVFQCITLEGWSEIMVYYMKVYTQYVFMFFLPLVFIGAFFLLNLTLAVINSKYSETINNIKAQKAKIEAEMNSLKGNFQSDGGEGQEIQDFAAEAEEDEQKSNHQTIGMYEFYIAKRALKKLLMFKNKHLLMKKTAEVHEKHMKKQLLELKEEDRKEVIRLQAIYNQGEQPITSPVAETQQKIELGALQPVKKTQVQKSQVKLDEQQRSIQKPIIEDARSEDEGDDLYQFLKDTGKPKINQEKEKNPDPTKAPQIAVGFGNPFTQKGSRRAILNDQAQELDVTHNGYTKEEKRKLAESLAFDKVVKNGDSKPLLESDHDNFSNSYNLSELGKEINQDDHALSDADKKQPHTLLDKDDGDGVESVILSESSFNDIVKPQQPKEMSDHKKLTSVLPHASSRNPFRRTLTNENKSKENIEQARSTQTGFHKFGANLALDETKMEFNDIQSSTSFQRTPQDGDKAYNSKQSGISNLVKFNKVEDKRKQQIQMYSLIDMEYFSSNKPKDPTEFIDKNKQKIRLNPGVKYVSTSQNEIFELRNKKNMEEQLCKINKYLKMPKYQEHGQFDASDDLKAIENWFEPYRLKNLYMIEQKEEFDFDNDESTALLLGSQPYETITAIAFSDYLNHLDTKFLSRRSDIIVTSTLSITLTPTDDEHFEPAHFAKMTDEEIKEYVQNRSEFRAKFVPIAGQSKDDIRSLTQIHLPSQLIVDNSDSSDEEKVYEMFGNDLSEDEDASQLSSMSPKRNSRKILLKSKIKKDLAKGQLPPSLLNDQLHPNEIPLLNKKNNRLYHLQKQKFDSKQQKFEKMHEKPWEKVFTLDEIPDLLSGKFHADDKDEDDVLESNDKNVYLNRAINVTKSEFAAEMKLEEFETAIANILSQDVAQNKKMDSDYIPASIKKEFNLPKDMQDLEINFFEVRNKDAQYPKKIHEWSGQQVLESSINMAQSKNIIESLNKVRVWPLGFAGLIKKFRFSIKMFVSLGVFDSSMTICVLLNTVVMASDYYGISEEVSKFLQDMNEVFTWIFICEMSLKLIAFGVAKYWANKLNWIDGGVVMLSIVEMLIASIGGGEGEGGGSLQAFRTIRVFRTFRVLRVTRVLRSLRQMKVIISVIQRSVMDFIYIAGLLFLFVLVYTLLGRQMFQGKFNFQDEELPRSNYEQFMIAFVTVWQVLTMENWQQVLFTSMRAAGGSAVTKILTAAYYISWIFAGNFILLNLFLAILLDSFVQEDDEDDLEELERLELEAEKRRQQLIDREINKRLKLLGKTQIDLKSKNSKKKKQKNFTGVKNELITVDVEEMNKESIKQILYDNKILKREKGYQEDLTIPDFIECENSLYLFARNNIVRMRLYWLQKHKSFENFIMLLIGLSSAKLAAESYLEDFPEDHISRVIGNKFDDVLTFLFFFESIFKIIALGLIMDDNSYLRDSWNDLDFFIVVTSLLDFLLQGQDIAFLKILRMLRMLRPLRVVSHNVEMKMIVTALFESFGSIMNVLIVILVVYLMFAIYAMNTYLGYFFYCSIDMYTLREKIACNEAGGSWKRFDSNFDSIDQALLTLFITASLEGWPDIMYQALDVTKKNMGPIQEFSTVSGVLFFVIFILVGSFFFLNFFVGVLQMNYQAALKQEKKGFTDQQLDWIEMQGLILNAEIPHKNRYKPSEKYGLRIQIYQLVESNRFEIIIMICIVANMIQMAFLYEGSGEGVGVFLRITNYIFTAIFFVEMILKLFVYRKAYFLTAWNKFDFFVVMSSLIDLVLEFVINKDATGESQGGALLTVGPQLARVLRVLRVSRVLRLAGKYKELMTLMETIKMSVKSLANVFLLLMLIFFIMATLATNLFSTVTEGDVISDIKNFKYFGSSFLLLFVISTGEDWNKLMFDCMKTEPYCTENKNCGSKYAPVFFLIFHLLVSQVMLNLFILVILEQFEKYYLDEDGALKKFKNDLNIFMEAWCQKTEKYSCIKIKENKQFFEFFKSLPESLRSRNYDQSGSKGVQSNQQIEKVMLQMQIRPYHGFIYFNELLYRLMRYKYLTFSLNKTMQVKELIMQYQLHQMTHQLSEESQKKNPTLEFLQGYSEGGFKDNVNPILAMMFYRASMFAWVNYNRKHRREQRRKAIEAERDGKLLSHRTLKAEHLESDNEEDQECESIEVQSEEELLITTESDEEQEVSVQSSRSRQLSKFGTLNKMQSEYQTIPSYNQTSPTKQGLAAKRQKIKQLIQAGSVTQFQLKSPKIKKQRTKSVVLPGDYVTKSLQNNALNNFGGSQASTPHNIFDLEKTLNEREKNRKRFAKEASSNKKVKAISPPKALAKRSKTLFEKKTDGEKKNLM